MLHETVVGGEAYKGEYRRHEAQRRGVENDGQVRSLRILAGRICEEEEGCPVSADAEQGLYEKKCVHLRNNGVQHEVEDGKNRNRKRCSSNDFRQ